MLKEERYDKILEILEEENYTSAQTLSRRLFVSLPTIRRDLAELQRRNQIVRSHGGAKKINTEHIVTPLDFRRTRQFAEKRRLCQAAGELIRDRDIVFLDASTTVSQMAEVLVKKNVTVVTNSIPLSLRLTQSGVKTLCTGGEIVWNSLGYAGSYAEAFVRKFNFDWMFFSCTGINDRGIIVDASQEETMLRRVVQEHTHRTVLLFDSTKLHASAPYNFVPIADVDLVITDAAPAEVEALCEKEQVIFA